MSIIFNPPPLLVSTTSCGTLRLRTRIDKAREGQSWQSGVPQPVTTTELMINGINADLNEVQRNEVYVKEVDKGKRKKDVSSGSYACPEGYIEMTKLLTQSITPQLQYASLSHSSWHKRTKADYKPLLRSFDMSTMLTNPRVDISFFVIG